jgi:two-component system cell cycle sensor histidine kinase/response regulator CckA
VAFQILIADDEAELRELFAKELQPQFRILTATNGREALALLRSAPGIQLLITDIRMLEMNGFELVEEALIWDPELKVVFITGYRDEIPPTPLLRAREIRTLRKPFEISQLVKLVEDMLSRP